MAITPMSHQAKSLKFFAKTKIGFDASDPGTGKTFVQITDFASQHKKDGKALLVLCPKSIMVPAWANDIRKFAPHLKVQLCLAGKRHESLAAQADVYILNHDGVKDLLKYTTKKSFWARFGRIVIDESSKFKHRTSARSKALAKIAGKFEHRRCMSGTPNGRTITDVWHQYYILDQGKRLGSSFFGFRNATCIPMQNGPLAEHIEWVDKPGVELLVAELVKDITIRHVFEDCVDIPENHLYEMSFQLTPVHFKQYKKFEHDQLMVVQDKEIQAAHAASLANKLQQIASGAVYSANDGTYATLASERYELILDLVEEREHSIVFYQWVHQLNELAEGCRKRGISYVIWDASRPQIEQEFQAGQYQVLFGHPESMQFGLTLTRATTSIFASPTYNLEHFVQGKKRIHRIGQKQKTETIVIVAEDTIDTKVWKTMTDRHANLAALLKEMAA